MSVKVALAERKVALPIAQIRADIVPASWSAEKRTLKISWGVGKKGLRQSWDGNYYEQLSMDPASVRMQQVQSGNAPFIDNHEARYAGNRAVLGVILEASIEGGEGTALVQLMDSELLKNVDAADTIRKLEAGVIRQMSVGYKVYKYERQAPVEGEEIPTYLAVDWEPFEFSCVPIGFDESASVRGQESRVSDCEFFNNLPKQRNEENSMTPEQIKEQERKAAEEAQRAAAATAAEVKAAAEKATADERTRQSEIRSICKKAGLDEAFQLRMVESAHSLDQVRSMAIDELAAKTETQIRNANPSVVGGGLAQAKERKESLENALLHRADPDKIKLTDGGRNFRGMTLIETARDFLQAAGIEHRGMDKMTIATRAFHSTSDFPEILANVANKSLRKGYDESPRTFLGWAKRASVSDFKQVSRAQLGEAPALEIVGEDGEIKRGTMGEGAEKYTLATYAKIVGITRKVIINDDLNAFTSLPAKFGFAAASLESDVVYAILTANAALADSVALFHATHRNLATGGASALSTTSIAELRKKMRVQKGVDGVRILNIVPAFAIVPAALETTLLQIVAPGNMFQANSVGNTVPEYMRNLTPVVEPRLDATSEVQFYMAANPGIVDTVEYAHLEGQEGVYSESRMGFDVDGMEVKARLDFAAKAIDFRGLAKSNGA